MKIENGLYPNLYADFGLYQMSRRMWSSKRLSRKVQLALKNYIPISDTVALS